MKKNNASPVLPTVITDIKTKLKKKKKKKNI